MVRKATGEPLSLIAENAQVHDADRAVINVQSGLRHRFDLLTDA